MWDELLAAIALLLILEGILPFLSPGKFRHALVQIVKMPDQVVRVIGLTCMTLGVIVLYVLKSLG